MSTLSSRLFAVFALGCMFAACGSPPIPLAVQKGETFSIAIGGEVGHGLTGFAGDYLGTEYTDPLRGRVVVELLNQSTAVVVGTLDTKLVGRMAPDPASDIGLRGWFYEPALGGGNTGIGIHEIVAVLRVPTSAPSGVFNLRGKRQIQTTSNGAWTDVANSTFSLGQSITILSSTGAETFSSVIPAWMKQAQPHPKVIFPLPLTSNVPPAAAHVEIDYPKTKVRVLGAIEEQYSGRQSIVTWSDDTVAGRVTLDLVAPPPTDATQASVRQLALVFEPLDYPSARSLQYTEFVVASSAFYDATGTAWTPPATIAASGIR